MVHVYLASVSHLPDPAQEPAVMNGLSEERKEKILKYKYPEDRKQSLGAGLLLKQVLSLWGENMERITYGQNGKPELNGIHFNVSHSHDMILCAVGSQPVGCDIEKIKKVPKGIVKRFFAPKESSYLEAFEEEAREDEFFRIWTMKESYIKMTGEGLGLELTRFEVIPGNPIELFRDGKRCACSIKEYELPGYKCTVCAEETEFAQLVRMEI